MRTGEALLDFGHLTLRSQPFPERQGLQDPESGRLEGEIPEVIAGKIGALGTADPSFALAQARIEQVSTIRPTVSSDRPPSQAVFSGDAPKNMDRCPLSAWS